jgi:hypothetical protein
MVVVCSSIILHRIPQILHRSGSVASFAIAGAITNITTLVIMNTIATLAIASSSLSVCTCNTMLTVSKTRKKLNPEMKLSKRCLLDYLLLDDTCIPTGHDWYTTFAQADSRFFEHPPEYLSA